MIWTTHILKLFNKMSFTMWLICCLLIVVIIIVLFTENPFQIAQTKYQKLITS